MRSLEAKRRGTLALLAVLFLLAVLTALKVGLYAAFLTLFFTAFAYGGYAQEARRVLEEEAARRLGLAFSPGPPGEDPPFIPLLPEGKPKVYGEIRGEVLGRPFRRFEARVAGRFGGVDHRFTGVLYEVELPRPFPYLHLAPRGWPTYPGERWPFLLELLRISGVPFALLARYLAGKLVLKSGTNPLLLLVFPLLYLYLFASWKLATNEAGLDVALEGELARRFRAWGGWDSWDSIGENTPLGQALLEMGRFLGPYWLRVEGTRLYLAFLGGDLPTSPLLSPEAALARWEARLRGEMGALEGLLRALAVHLGCRGPKEAGGQERLTQDRPLSG